MGSRHVDGTALFKVRGFFWILMFVTKFNECIKYQMFLEKMPVLPEPNNRLNCEIPEMNTSGFFNPD